MLWVFDFLFLFAVFYIEDILFENFLVFDSLGLKILFGVIFLLGAFWLYVFFTKRTDTVVIANKALYVKRYSQYYVYKTTDDHVFINRNDFVVKNNASELDASLKIGHKYRITTYRMIFIFSADRNILFAHEIKSHGRKKVVKKSK